MSLCPPVRRTFSDEPGPGTFHSLGNLPKRKFDRKLPVFHIPHDDDDDDDDDHATTTSAPFPRSTSPPSSSPSPPSSSSPSSPSQLSRGASSPILLSSGKPLKSSLKSSSSSPSVLTHMHLRARSEPSTPATTPKNVHFPEKDLGLATVRFFNCKARPASVSSPNGNGDETETEGEDAPPNRFPFPPMPPMVTYEIDPTRTSSIPSKNCLDANVLLESLDLSSSSFVCPAAKPLLTGSVLVRNLAFEKNVAIRFTLDDWQTVSEVSAHYVNSITRLPSPITLSAPVPDDTDSLPGGLTGWDRFAFSIRLEDYAQSLSTRTIWLVSRYRVDSTYPEPGCIGYGPGGEWWDNNAGNNYRVGFRPTIPTTSRSRPRRETIAAPIPSQQTPPALPTTCKEHALGLMIPSVSNDKTTETRPAPLKTGKLSLCNYVPPTVHATSSVTFSSADSPAGLSLSILTNSELATSRPLANEDSPSPASSTVSTPSNSPTITPRVIIGGQPATYCDSSSDREDELVGSSKSGHIANWDWSSSAKVRPEQLSYQRTDLVPVPRTLPDSSLYNAFVTQWCFAQGPSPNQSGYGDSGIMA